MLAPNVTMALEILRMPLMELRTFLERQMEENPLLEIEETPHQEEQQQADAEPRSEETAPERSPEEDWMSHWRTAGEAEDPDSDDDRERQFDQRLANPQSLHESVRMQLGCHQLLTDEQRRFGEFLIQHLNDSGYLDTPLEELAEAAGATIPQLEAVLTTIQSFDPPGVGARDLRECLMIQLSQHQLVMKMLSPGAIPERSKKSSVPQHPEQLAYLIVKDHFPLFTQQRLSALAKATGAPPADISQAVACLKQLNPKPGRAFSTDLSPSIVPDLIIHHREKHYDVELNEPHLPSVAVNRAYHRMLRDPKTPSEAKEFLANKFRQASWLMKAIDERNATLLSIGRCLISLQRDFLEHGQRAIKPLTQAQVAELIGRHPSTVSRAIAGKTIDTPYGVFRLEQLFASSVPQNGTNGAAGAATLSDEHIKSELQRLIQEEDVKRPLSDATLAKRLADRNISVARRTIAKYRTSLKILPAHLRKRRI